MQEWLINLSTNHVFLVYLFVIVFACAEGPILAMIAGALIKLGYFSFFPMYGALIIGDLLGDSIWYVIGKYYGYAFIKRFGKYVSVTEQKVLHVMRIFNKYKYKILILSKISNGLGLSFVTLLTAGMTKVPFVKYIGMNLLGQFVWSGALIAVGYFFSDLYLQVNGIFEKIGVVVFFVIIIALFFGFVKYMRSRTNNL